VPEAEVEENKGGRHLVVAEAGGEDDSDSDSEGDAEGAMLWCGKEPFSGP